MPTVFNTLEGIVDKEGLAVTLNLLAKICSEKSEHIHHSWQDEDLARCWDRAAGLLYKLESEINKILP